MCDQQMLRPACACAQSDQSLCLSLEYSMSVKLPTEHHLEFLSLKRGCRDVGVYTCQHATLLETSCHGSYIKRKETFITGVCLRKRSNFLRGKNKNQRAFTCRIGYASDEHDQTQNNSQPHLPTAQLLYSQWLGTFTTSIKYPLRSRHSA